VSATYHECKQLTRYEINAALCTMCDKCREVCKDYAIEGQKLQPYKGGFTPFRIRQQRCTHCGECIKVCPEKAVVIIEKDREAGNVEPVRTLVCTAMSVQRRSAARRHVPSMIWWKRRR